MRFLKNPLDDCLKILAAFGGLIGLYTVYKLFQTAGTILTPSEIWWLTVTGTVIWVTAVSLVFLTLGVLLSGRLVLVLTRYQELRKNRGFVNDPSVDLERLERMATSALAELARRVEKIEMMTESTPAEFPGHDDAPDYMTYENRLESRSEVEDYIPANGTMVLVRDGDSYREVYETAGVA